jgi:hypothetical protein
MDILGLDFVHLRGDREDKFVILELNDTAIGLVRRTEEEDMRHMREVVIANMNAQFSRKEGEDAGGAQEVAKLQEQIRALILEKLELQQQLDKSKE